MDRGRQPVHRVPWCWWASRTVAVTCAGIGQSEAGRHRRFLSAIERAATNATSTIPIVFVAVADPVRVGLIESLARPGASVTGLATVAPGGFMAKSLEVLKQALPKATRIAVLLNPSNAVTSALFPLEGPPAAQQLGVTLQVLHTRTPEDVEHASISLFNRRRKLCG